MPIRPDLRKFYTGPQWQATRARILRRAGNKCEQCHAPDHQRVERGPRGIWRSLLAATGAPWRNSNGNATTFEPVYPCRRTVLIVLTVAHLNHKPGDDRGENLKALCQWCHVNFDVPVNLAHSRKTRLTRKDAARPLLRGSL